MRKIIMSVVFGMLILAGCSQKENYRSVKSFPLDLVDNYEIESSEVNKQEEKVEEKQPTEKEKVSLPIQSNSKPSNEKPIEVEVSEEQKTEVKPEEPIVVEEEPENIIEEKPTYTYNIGNCGKLFDTEQEANEEATYMWDTFDDGKKYISGYFVYSTGDKWSIDYDYSYWE